MNFLPSPRGSLFFSPKEGETYHSPQQQAMKEITTSEPLF